MTWYLKYKLQLNINFEIVYNNNWIIVKIKALLSFKKKNSFQFVSKEELLFERALFEFYRPIFEIIPFALRFRHTLATTIMNYSGSLRIGAQFPAKTLANLSSPATTTLGIPCSLLGKCDAFCIWMPATWNYPAVSLSFFLSFSPTPFTLRETSRNEGIVPLLATWWSGWSVRGENSGNVEKLCLTSVERCTLWEYFDNCFVNG